MIFKPPTPIDLNAVVALPRVFLAGAIDQGTAPNWQSQVEAPLDALGAAVFNPRRDDWDATWVQSIKNAQFREQVEWELDAMNCADTIAMNFVAGYPSPITLLELGLFAGEDKLIVHCPDGFWRKGNVEVVCDHHGIELVESLDALIAAVIERVQDRTSYLTESRKALALHDERRK